MAITTVQLFGVQVELRNRKERRWFQRLATGLQIARNNRAYMRFMTLTSPIGGGRRWIKESFSALKKRIERATWRRDRFWGFKFNRYICFRTSEGNGVLHVIYWGRFIPQAWLSRVWQEIHGAFRVDIRACGTDRKKVNGLVGYLLTNYLKDQPIERLSYGWKWAWLGFCKSWENVKGHYGSLRCGVGELTARVIHKEANFGNYTTRHAIEFKTMFQRKALSAWECILWNPPDSSRQTKLSGAKSLKWYIPELKTQAKRLKGRMKNAIGCKGCPNVTPCVRKLTEDRKNCSWFVWRTR